LKSESESKTGFALDFFVGGFLVEDFDGAFFLAPDKK